WIVSTCEIIPNVAQLLQRVYPGSLPPVRRDIHNLVVPLDFSDPADVELVVETLQTFVQRQVPIRFALVPLLKSKPSKPQAKVVYHLLDTYGISAVLSHLEAVCFHQSVGTYHLLILSSV